MRQIIKVIKWVIILLLVFGAAFLSYVLVKINQPLTTTPRQEKIFEVPVGWSTRQVAEELEEEKLISRALFFELYIYFKKQGRNIQAGQYAIQSSMSIREIAEILTTGKALSKDLKLTVLEGWTQEDIANALSEAGLPMERVFVRFVAGDFRERFDFLQDASADASLEGYLFPDTYLFAPDSEAQEIAGKMLKNFGQKLTADLRDQIKNQGQSIYEVVTLASIIEKEVGRNVKKGEKLSSGELEKLRQERRLVSSVFHNRLKIGKALESDATVAYITGSKSNRATLEETKIDSPYNTYRYAGLPPGPIANPSLDALLAAIEPAQTDYLFFLTAPDGTAYFAKTLEEHIINREKYLE